MNFQSNFIMTIMSEVAANLFCGARLQYHKM